MPPSTHLQLLLREVDLETAQTIAAAEPAEAIALIEALAPQKMPAAHYGASALLEFGPDAAPALKRWLLAHDSRALAVLWATLNNSVDPSAGLEAFGELLDHDDTALVAAAVAAVGNCGPSGLRYADRLRALAETGSDSWLRSHAMRALGQVGSKEIDLLIKAVREGDEDENLAAIAALGRFGPDAREAVDAICDSLDLDAPQNAMAASLALIRIGERSPRVGDALAAAIADTEDPDVGPELLRAIGALGAPSPAARAALAEALLSEGADKRAAATIADYLVSGNPAAVRANLAETAWFLREWQIDPEPFADRILSSLEARSREPGAAFDETGMIEMLQELSAKVSLERLGPDEFEIKDPSAEADTDVADPLIGLAQRLGDAAAIPALERIAADERNPQWTREMAADAVRVLQRGNKR
ncbi:MAG: HEAT repeat domain-containing protein [Planctomycetota bacterium]|jgi:hypothetical protein